MGTPAENVIANLEQLADSENREDAATILSSTLQLEFLPISDDELLPSAEEIFRELDSR